MTFTLPFPPTLNTYWRHGRGYNYISKQGKAFRENVLAAVWQKGKPTPLTGRLTVHILLLPPDRRRRDVDNHAKATLDALQHAGVFADDEQIDDLRIVRGQITTGGSCIVEITTL